MHQKSTKQPPHWRHAAFPYGAHGLAHAHSTKRFASIWGNAKRTSLLKTQFSQVNSKNGTFSLTNLSLWDEHLVSRAQQSRWGWWLHWIKPIPESCFDRRLPISSQQSPCLFSTGRALKMESELWKHHLPCTSKAGARAQHLQFLPRSSHQLLGFISKVNPAYKLSSRQRNTPLNNEAPQWKANALYKGSLKRSLECLWEGYKHF